MLRRPAVNLGQISESVVIPTGSYLRWYADRCLVCGIEIDLLGYYTFLSTRDYGQFRIVAAIILGGSQEGAHGWQVYSIKSYHHIGKNTRRFL